MPAIEVAKKRINMPEIRVKAKALGITPGKMKKAELIHAIQQAEGYTPKNEQKTDDRAQRRSAVFNLSWVFAFLDSCYFPHPSFVSSSAEFGIQPDLHYFS